MSTSIPGESGGHRRLGRLGRYVLLERIADGGMAEIYGSVVLGDGGFFKRVAIKRIHGHLLDPEYIELFMREARLAALLQHPNLVEVYDFGGIDGNYFMAMQWVDGFTLDDLLNRLVNTGRELEVGLAVQIACDIAAGLHYMHTFIGPDDRLLTVVHRDVSPSNVMISFSGVVKLTDFGVSEVQGSGETTESMNGKITYMAPEILDGEPASPQSDQYSLAVVLYEMLTSRRMFEYTSDLETITLVKTKAIPPPSVICEYISPELDDVVMRALSKNPEDRYPDIEAFRRALLEQRGPGPAIDLGRVMDGLFYRERADAADRFDHGIRRAQAEEDGNTDEVPLIPSGPEPTLEKVEGDPVGTVLVVDDVEDNRDMMSRVLKMAGHDVIAASGGAEALSVIASFPVELVLLDVNMPRMNGFDVLERIRKTKSRLELPVIMVTARSSSEDIVLGLDLGANDYVSKPIDFDVLEARVKSQLFARQAFEKMQASAQFFQSIAENATELVFEASQALTVVHMSPASERLLGKASRDVEGTDFLTLFEGSERARMAEAIEAIGADAEPLSLEALAIGRDGTSVATRIRIQPARDPSSGTWTGFRGAIRF